MTQTMQIKPVFDGGACTSTRDGVLMRDGDSWLIRQYSNGQGWRFVRHATAAEVATAERLREKLQIKRQTHTMEVSL